MRLGKDARLSPQAVIARPELVDIGDYAAIDPFTVIMTAATLGNYVHIGPHCSVLGGWDDRLVMGDFSSLAGGCRIICSSDDCAGEGLTGAAIPLQFRVVRISTVTLQRFVSVGVDVIILPGVTIGEGAAIAPGTMVERDLEPWGLYEGRPARRTGTRPRDRILALAKELVKQASRPDYFSADSQGTSFVAERPPPWGIRGAERQGHRRGEGTAHSTEGNEGNEGLEPAKPETGMTDEF